MKKLVLALTALSLIGGAASPALAAPSRTASTPACRGHAEARAAGKFVKCPPPPAAKCRDAKGHYVKCPAKPRVCRNAQGHYAKCR